MVRIKIIKSFLRKKIVPIENFKSGMTEKRLFSLEGVT